jgi:hypothetical protein
MKSYVSILCLGTFLAALFTARAVDTSTSLPWTVGAPIVTYWAGPPMTDAVAQQMVAGGFNLVWCDEKELDVVQRHGLRGQLHDPLLTPSVLEDAGQKPKLDALVERARTHPAMYAYFITDEPNATNFASLGKLVSYLRQKDPAHLAYINLFPTYATNEQLGNSGDAVTAYQAHLNQYVDVVHPSLISYDHYQFTTNGDSSQYFLNLALIRRTSQAAALPFLNIVQACTWTTSMRVPNGDEMRFLVYTTLAYGAQGISYYVYSCQGHTGGFANKDGTPTPLHEPISVLNREFVAIGTQLQPLQSLGVYHVGMLPPGAEALPANAPFTLEPTPSTRQYRAPDRVKGIVLGYFGPTTRKKNHSKPTHVLVVNLDYKEEASLGVRAPARLELFNLSTGQWTRAEGKVAKLHLPPGGGALLRTR